MKKAKGERENWELTDCDTMINIHYLEPNYGLVARLF
jgi:hypothetical protein